MPYGEQLSINPCVVKPGLQPLQASIGRLILCIRATEKARKAALEARKNLLVYQHLVMDDNKRARQTYLRDVYPQELRGIGVTLLTLRARMHNIAIVEDDGIFVSLAGTREKMFDILTGDDAFERVVGEGEGLTRPVYVKKPGILSEPEKHYVKDHFGRFTRRYAYVEKPWDVFEILMTTGILRGKNLPGLDDDPRKKTASVVQKYQFGESADDPLRMSVRELAFVNQEDGSTVQRGLPLGSTPKPLHGNEGYRFGRFDGVLLQVDLARIPMQEDYLLLNLYCFDAQRSTAQNPTLGLITYNIRRKGDGSVVRKGDKPKATALESKEHTDASTQKNRELLLLTLPLAAITTVCFHSAEKLRTHGDGVKRMIADAGGVVDVPTRHVPHCATFEQELFPND
ncbi:hypothetical protein IAI51_21205 [Pseudomonas sp. N40(2020)]|uniref:hypothetical protein n=1 Tax=Pseudomonas sp. N40(2020) TaxID=2767798 RepID=UPI001656F831|nr:hypothetical protein [Pseudomonas sp. N40(2020)]MBC8999049.1 hypothetical protein [Pseudomonas sp. N40(2020)]